jgi:cysteine-rich repeat protein
MSVILSITVRLLSASLAIITISACRSTEGPAQPGTITCPPGMTLAAKQGICLHGSCGNDIVDADEACDDGNVIAGDGCSPDCQSTESCGNGTVDHAVGEVCDDGNTASNALCCSDCRSCPELAVLPVDEPEAPAVVNAVTEPEPCPPALPAPEASRAVVVQKVHGSHPTRPAAPAAPAMGRLAAQSHARTGEELALARSTITELEQRNAALLQSLEDALRELTETQRRLARGVALQ